MNNFEEIPLTKAYITADEKIVLITKATLDNLLHKFGSLKNVPKTEKILVKQLLPESDFDQASNSCIYRIHKDIEIEEIDSIEEKLVRCSNFSTYH